MERDETSRVSVEQPQDDDAPADNLLRVYRGVISDSRRWHRFNFRSDDIIITTPSKCGTTWMQSIVGTLIFLTPNISVSTVSLWFDALLRSEAEATAILEAQTHRRFLKTHCPMDGLPRIPGVTYIVVIRHPLDVALSNYDHSANQCRQRTNQLLQESGHGIAARSDDNTYNDNSAPPKDRTEYLRWWIDNEKETDGAGPYGLASYCKQVKTYWDARDDANVHLFHYSDLWNDLDGEMRRVANVLGTDVDEKQWQAWIEASSLDSMKQRADNTAPEAHLGLWKSTNHFFAKGGRRDWSSLLTDDDIAHFESRLQSLAGDAIDWILSGNRGNSQYASIYLAS